ncbi:MAG: hypothetical protein J6X88_02705 [Bacteroidales bacterium]|nr:hypothetical protein [Bacteroidales bacterium]
MNTKIIKIAVIVLVVTGFVVYSILNLHSIDNMSFLKVEPFNFSTYVDQQAAETIKDQPKQSAQNAYLQLYQEISTEASLNHTTSSNPSPAPLLSQNDAKECYTTIFLAYFSVFRQWADAVFQSNNWNSRNLDQIKSEADSLRNYQGVTRPALDSLEKFSSYVVGYRKAYNLLYAPCSRKATYDNLCNEARSYCVYPYRNNGSIGPDFANKVGNAARQKWHKSITDEVNDFARHNDYYYNSQDALDYDYTVIYDRITEYGSSLLGSEIATLQQAYSRLKEGIEQRQSKI